MELMPREPDGHEQENTTPQRDVYKRQAYSYRSKQYGVALTKRQQMGYF